MVPRPPSPPKKERTIYNLPIVHWPDIFRVCSGIHKSPKYYWQPRANVSNVGSELSAMRRDEVVEI